MIGFARSRLAEDIGQVSQRALGSSNPPPHHLRQLCWGPRSSADQRGARSWRAPVHSSEPALECWFAGDPAD